MPPMANELFAAGSCGGRWVGTSRIVSTRPSSKSRIVPRRNPFSNGTPLISDRPSIFTATTGLQGWRVAASIWKEVVSCIDTTSSASVTLTSVSLPSDAADWRAAVGGDGFGLLAADSCGPCAVLFGNSLLGGVGGGAGADEGVDAASPLPCPLGSGTAGVSFGNAGTGATVGARSEER